VVHTCKRVVMFDNNDWCYRSFPERSWRCRACSRDIVKEYVRRFEEIDFQFMVTFMTQVPYAPPFFHLRNLKSGPWKLMLQALRYKHDCIQYFWAMGATTKENVHFHLLIRFARPELGWIKRRWKKLTGSHIVHISPARRTSVGYVANNAARLPVIPRARLSPMDLQDLRYTHRVGMSRNVVPPRAPSGRYRYEATEKRWDKSLVGTIPPRPSTGSIQP